jgi:hypothetical protein
LIALLGTLATWWPVLVLLYVPRFLGELAFVVWQRTRHTLDHRIPDDLPMTAGEWLTARIAELRYPVTALVTSNGNNAYWCDARLIQLRTQTFFKADPVYWADAAHELGHARLHVEVPRFTVVRQTAVALRMGLIAAGVGLAMGRVLYALPIAGTLAFRCFAVAAGSTIFTLIDEAAASVIAYRELRASPAFTAAHRRAAARMLIASFATYLTTYAAYALLLCWWPLFERLAGDRAPLPAQLTGLGWAVAAAATLGCVVGIVSELIWVLAPEPHHNLTSRGRRWRWLDLASRLSNLIVIWLAWDHRVDTTHAWCAMLAAAASCGTLRELIDRPLTIVHAVVSRLLARFRGPGHHGTARYLDAVKQDTDLILGGNRWVRWLAYDRAVRPPWYGRLANLTVLGFVPLLVALWLR